MNAYSPNTLNKLKPSPVVANLTRIKIRNSCLLFCTEGKVKKAIACYCPFKECEENFLNIFLQNYIFLQIKTLLQLQTGWNFTYNCKIRWCWLVHSSCFISSTELPLLVYSLHTWGTYIFVNPNCLWWVQMGISPKERVITEEPMKLKIWKK